MPARDAVKVVTFLTMPIDATTANPPLQAGIMQSIKEAFLNPDAIASIVSLVAAPLGRHPRMSEDDQLVVQLVLTFIRNLLAVPDPAPGRSAARGDIRERLQQEFLLRLFEENVMELLLPVAQHATQRPFKAEVPLLLDIFWEIFKVADPTKLHTATQPPPPPTYSKQAATVAAAATASASAATAAAPRQQAAAAAAKPIIPGLAAAAAQLEKEKAMRAAKMSKAPGFHARFSAHYQVRQATGLGMPPPPPPPAGAGGAAAAPRAPLVPLVRNNPHAHQLGEFKVGRHFIHPDADVATTSMT